jgi:hypothetical protein
MSVTTKRRRGRPALWTSGRQDEDHFYLYNMLKLAQEEPIKPYALARETFRRHVNRERERFPDCRIIGDERVHIARLGNKLNDLLQYAELSLYVKNGEKDAVEAIMNNRNEYTEEEIRREALEIIWRLLAEPYEPNYETDSIDEWLSESEIRRLVEGRLRLWGCDP